LVWPHCFGPLPPPSPSDLLFRFDISNNKLAHHLQHASHGNDAAQHGTHDLDADVARGPRGGGVASGADAVGDEAGEAVAHGLADGGEAGAGDDEAVGRVDGGDGAHLGEPGPAGAGGAPAVPAVGAGRGAEPGGAGPRAAGDGVDAGAPGGSGPPVAAGRAAGAGVSARPAGAPRPGGGDGVDARGPGGGARLVLRAERRRDEREGLVGGRRGLARAAETAPHVIAIA